MEDEIVEDKSKVFAIDAKISLDKYVNLALKQPKHEYKK
jgi:hypothetical protein